MKPEQNRRAPGGALSTPAFRRPTTAVPSRADGRGGQRHLPVAPPRSPVSTRFASTDPEALRAQGVRILIRDWATIRLESAARRLNLREDEAAALVRSAGGSVFRRAGDDWVRGLARDERRFRDKDGDR